MDRGAWQAIVHWVAKSGTEQPTLSLHFLLWGGIIVLKSLGLDLKYTSKIVKKEGVKNIEAESWTGIKAG